MKGSVILVVVAVLAVAVMVLVMAKGVEVHNQEQALAAYRSYLLEARQLTDAGQEPTPPGKVPLPKGYTLTLNGDFVVLTKDGAEVEKERYRKLVLRSGFETPFHPTGGYSSFTSGDIQWRLYDWWCYRFGCTDGCGGSGVINSSDYTGTGSNLCTPLEGRGMLQLRGRSWIFSDPIDLSDGGDVTLSVWWRGDFYSPWSGAYLFVLDGRRWVRLECIGPEKWGCSRTGNRQWYRESFNVTRYINPEFRIRFLFLARDPRDALWVDSVSITGGW